MSFKHSFQRSLAVLKFTIEQSTLFRLNKWSYYIQKNYTKFFLLTKYIYTKHYGAITLLSRIFQFFQIIKNI